MNGAAGSNRSIGISAILCVCVLCLRRLHITRLNISEATDSDSIFRRTLLGYYAEGMHANFKENMI